MAVPRGPKHRRRRGAPYRRWPRRLLIVVNVVVAVFVATAGSVYGYYRYTLASIHTQPAHSLTANGDGGSSPKYDGLPPENILLIGNQSRIGTTNPAYGGSSENASLADVMMILHLDPRTRQASLLSIPRDLFAPMPAGSPVGDWSKLNGALNDGNQGPNNLIAAIQQDFGIPINHFVEIDFSGFLKTVNALGGIRMYFPERLYDGTSDLGIYHTGCQLIRGPQALALVRSRHLQYDPPGVSPSYPPAWPSDPESDLSRIVRDHVFLKVLITTAERKGLSDPFTAANFINALIDQVTIDPALKAQLLTLVKVYGHLAPSSLKETTIPVDAGGALNGYVYGGYDYGDVLFPRDPADMAAIEKWDPGVYADAVAPKRVVVADATGTGSAGTIADGLRRAGVSVAGTSTAPVQASFSETLVQYHPGQVAMALDVEKHLAGAVMLRSSGGVRSGTVEIVLGGLVSVTGAHASGSSPSSTGSTSTTAPASGASGSGASGTSPTTKAPTTTTTTVPAPSGTTGTPSADKLAPWDPRPC